MATNGTNSATAGTGLGGAGATGGSAAAGGTGGNGGTLTFNGHSVGEDAFSDLSGIVNIAFDSGFANIVQQGVNVNVTTIEQ